MSNPKDIFSSEEYHNYRWVRLSIWVFVIGGWVVLFGGVSFFLGTLAGMDMGRPGEKLPLGLGIFMIVAALFAIVGGLSGLRANRRWSWLIYVIAFPYLFAIPIGTILAYIIFKGMPAYLKSSEKLADGKPQDS